MQLDPIRKAARAHPFTPFRLNLVNGAFVKIPRWQNIIVGPSSVIRLYPSGKFEAFGEDDIVNMELLTEHESSSTGQGVSKLPLLKQIELALSRTPFSPFTIKLKKGKAFRVRRLGYLAMGSGIVIRSSPKHKRVRIINEDEIESVLITIPNSIQQQ